ncbi:MAG: hypothetical protein FWG90_11195 [Oscillospiraceae bacterium]|nr:hypothetical protein [Oscillospiraceae bacterium]
MLNSKQREAAPLGRVINMYEKPVELMSEEERDAYFIDFSGLTYAEFLEKYKNDTPEILDIERQTILEKYTIKA